MGENGPMRIGYAAALEQFHPTEILEYAAFAEANGFSGVMAADHFQPWVPAQGQSSFVWNVLSALGMATRGDLGPGVTAPTFRWHPAMVAQASATLEAMFPGRHWLGIGSGEALNEHIVGQYWPEAPERINRMFEAIEIITKLFTGSLAGKDVKHIGSYYKLESTRLWTMPATPPPIYVATGGPVTARRPPEVRGPRLRRHLPPQRGAQPARVDRGLRPRGPAETGGVGAARPGARRHPRPHEGRRRRRPDHPRPGRPRVAGRDDGSGRGRRRRHLLEDRVQGGGSHGRGPRPGGRDHVPDRARGGAP